MYKFSIGSINVTTKLITIKQSNKLIDLKRRLLSKSSSRFSYDSSLTIELQKNYGEETIEKKRLRLRYQSRKRGMLENGLLLSCFAKKYLNEFNGKQLDEYDYLINKVSNEWDLYYWAVGKDEVPKEFNNSIFKLLKEFSSNELKESRIAQPPLH